MRDPDPVRRAILYAELLAALDDLTPHERLDALAGAVGASKLGSLPPSSRIVVYIVPVPQPADLRHWHIVGEE